MDADIPSTGIAAQGLGKPALQLDCLGLDSGAVRDSLQDLKHICPAHPPDPETRDHPTTAVPISYT